MSISSVLPAPSRTIIQRNVILAPESSLAISKTSSIPPYGMRQNFVPRKADDFGNGGAFPEIHLAQFPLGMGLQTPTQGSLTLSVQTDQDGKVRYEELLGHRGKNSMNEDMRVFSRAEHAQRTLFGEEALQRPDKETRDDLTNKTRQQLEKLVGVRIQSTVPSKHIQASNEEAPQFIRYTPSQASANFNSGATARTIKLVTAQKDPIDPNYFKYVKTPHAPNGPPIPVMHSPPKKLTAKDHAAWKIPPAISNWKNNLGYTIALDKRLAADGRGLEAPVLSDRFASLSTAMTIAESSGRAEIEARKRATQQVREREREEKNRMLSQVAQEVRSDMYVNSQIRQTEEVDEETEKANEENNKVIKDTLNDVRRTVERDYKLNKYKGSKLSVNQRDIVDPNSVNKAKAPPSSESLYDRRLFNTDGGLDSGFGNDEDYNVYTKPLFSSEHSGTLYRPVGDSDTYGIAEEELNKIKDTSRFQPARGFEGTEKRSGPRTQPVEFTTSSKNDEYRTVQKNDKREHRKDSDDESDRKRHRK